MNFGNKELDLHRGDDAAKTHPPPARCALRLTPRTWNDRWPQSRFCSAKRNPGIQGGRKYRGQYHPAWGYRVYEFPAQGGGAGGALVKTHRIRPDALPKVPPLTTHAYLRLLRSIAGSTLCPGVNFPPCRRFSAPRPSCRRCQHRPPAEPTERRPPPYRRARRRKPFPIQVPGPQIPVRHALA